MADFAGLLETATRQHWAVICLDLGIDTSTITGAAMAQVTCAFAEMERKSSTPLSASSFLACDVARPAAVSAGLYAVVMASTDCGWCGRLVHLRAVSPLYTVPFAGGFLRQAAYQCPNCRRLVVAWERGGSYEQSTDVPTAQNYTWGWDVKFGPAKRDSQEFPDVPQHIAEAATEATLCLSVGAYRAVGSLARAVIETTAKDKKADGTTLFDRINALADAEHIRSHTKAQAHEVRHFGNGMAHGDFTEPLTKEDAEEIVTLMAEILDEVYQSPARLEHVKAAREAKKAGTAVSPDESQPS